MAGATLDSLAAICTCASATINLALFLYFFLFAVADLFVKLCHKPVSRMRLAHKHCADFMRNFYFECVFYSTQAVVTVVISSVFYQLNLSFEGELRYEVKLLFAAAVGFHIIVFLRIVFLAQRNLAKYTVLMLEFIVLLCLIGILVTDEDAPLGMIFLISDADQLFANIGKLHKVIRLKGTRRYRRVLYVGSVASVLSRAVLPLAYLIVAFSNGSPLKMGIASVVVFFVAIVACGGVNTWRIHSSVVRLRRKEERIIEVPYANMTGDGNNTGPKPEDVATISENMEVPPSYHDVFGTAELELASSDPLSFSNPLAEETNNDGNIANSSDLSLNANAVVDISTLEVANQSLVTDHEVDPSV